MDWARISFSFLSLLMVCGQLVCRLGLDWSKMASAEVTSLCFTASHPLSGFLACSCDEESSERTQKQQEAWTQNSELHLAFPTPSRGRRKVTFPRSASSGSIQIMRYGGRFCLNLERATLKEGRGREKKEE